MAGPAGSGKSTLTALLFDRGCGLWGDDVVRFATDTLEFSGFERSIKIAQNTLHHMTIARDAALCDSPGTFLAADSYYISPAAFRSEWLVPPGRVGVIVQLDASRHSGRAHLTPISAAHAAVALTQLLLGPEREALGSRGDARLRLLEAVSDAAAWEAWGADPVALAAAIEEAAR